jgi:hypothetical protein
MRAACAPGNFQRSKVRTCLAKRWRFRKPPPDIPHSLGSVSLTHRNRKTRRGARGSLPKLGHTPWQCFRMCLDWFAAWQSRVLRAACLKNSESGFWRFHGELNDNSARRTEFSSATRAVRRVATAEEMAKVFAGVDLRERLILKLAGIAGMRPGEIFSSSMGESGTAVRRDSTAGVPRGY